MTSKAKLPSLLVLLLGAALSFSLAACSSSSLPPSGPHASEAPSSRPITGLSEATMLSITAPAMCLRPPGQLVNGQLPIDDPLDNGFTEIVGIEQHKLRTISGATSAFPSGLTAIAFDCSVGGVDWPMVISLYNASASLVGSIDLGKLDDQEHSDIQTMSFRGDALHVTWFTNGVKCTGADDSVPRSADFSVAADGTYTIANSLTASARSSPVSGSADARSLRVNSLW